MHDLITRDAQAFFHQHGSSPCIGALRGGRGAWLEDPSGRRILDLHGNSAHHIGYAHPRLVAALHDQLDRLVFSPRRFTNEPATRLAEALSRRFLGGRSKVLLAPGGTSAVEIALRLTRIASGRSAIVALEGSYHGHGMATLGLSTARLDSRLGSGLPDIHHATPYWDEVAGGAERMLADIEQLFATIEGGVACLIAEPIRSTCVVPPAGLWPEVRRLCDLHGVRLVFDEVPCGLGKTGRFFAHEHFGAEPDCVVLGKALGGGMIPIAAVIADAALDVAPELSIGHYTHEKNPLSATAALTVLEIIDDERLGARAPLIEQMVRHSVATCSGQRPAGMRGLSGVRGLGAMLAVELGPGAIGTTAADVVDRALADGVSTTAKDARSVGFSPPLTITEAEIDWAVGILDRATRLPGAPHP